MLEFLTHKTLAPLVLRLGLAVIFIYHGLDKINPEKNWGAGWHPELPVAQQLAVAYGELLGGIAVAFGFLTRLAALGLIGIMAGAIATVHLPQGFDNRAGGFEYNFAIIVMAAALVLTGAGVVSLDKLLVSLWRREPAKPAAARR